MTYHLLRQRILRELREVLDPLEAQREVRRWFEDGLGLDATCMARQGAEAVPAAVERKVDGWLRRRRQGEPWALILGWTPFFGRPFKVGKGVLIPQTESETTVRTALEVGRALGVRRCVDVGAGVGNIGLTLALETDWDLTLTEIDAVTLRLARSNAKALGVGAHFVDGDLLQPVPEPLELVVANMPFVDEAEAAAMEADFNYEPAVAMLAPDRGMGLSHALLGQALARGAVACVVEIGAGQGRELRPRALNEGWRQVRVIQDARGQDRVIVAQAR